LACKSLYDITESRDRTHEASTLSVERNPFSAKNQTLRSYGEASIDNMANVGFDWQHGQHRASIDNMANEDGLLSVI